MTLKEKAKELVEKFANVLPSVFYNSEESKNYPTAKKCVLIAVDEIINITAPECDIYEPYYQELDDSQTQVYWNEVKQEIEKL